MVEQNCDALIPAYLPLLLCVSLFKIIMNRKETIGLVTFSSTYDNYGQVLQALAIQEYLKERGHEVILLRKPVHTYDYIKPYIKLIVKKTLSLFSNSSYLQRSYEIDKKNFKNRKIARKNEKIHTRFFEEFRKRHFVIASNDEKSLEKKQITVLCAGSDQIWGVRNSFHFLDFGNKVVKRISIASSTGNSPVKESEKLKISKWLKAFSLITVREDSGVAMCNELGINKAIKILDPTLLHDYTFYNKYKSQAISKDYIFVYLLSAKTGLSYEEIFEFSQKNGLDVKYVTGQGREDDNEKLYATIPEWLSLMNEAKYVITNSFHGMAFSIIYRKQFLVLPRIGELSQNERISCLAHEMGLEERVYKNNLDELFMPIKYEKAEKALSDNRQKLNILLEEVNL